MKPFNFTRKKYLSLSEQGRHKHLMAWLSSVYHHLTTNRITPIALNNFARQYQQILSWGKMSSFTPPAEPDLRSWMEAVCDAIHYHRTNLGIRFKDHMKTGGYAVRDKNEPANRIDCHIALDGLRSVFNIGSIIRNCEAAGFSSVILGNCPGSENPGIRKTAMGADQWICEEKTDNLAQYLVEKQNQGYLVVGIETIQGAQSYDQFKWPAKTIVVMGNEEYGISSHVAGSCEKMVTIPMQGQKNSINVASAAAIVCFTIARALTTEIA